MDNYGKDFETVRESIEEATRYNWNDQTLTLPELIAQAVSKDIAFMSGMGTGKGFKPTYHVNMVSSEGGDSTTGFKVRFNQWIKAQLPDATSEHTKKKFVAWSKGRDVFGAPKVTEAEYQEALAKVKGNRGKPTERPRSGMGALRF